MTKIPKHKVVFIGYQGVGKSSLAGRFIYDVYEEKYQPTIGIDFLTRSVKIGEYASNVWVQGVLMKISQSVSSHIKPEAFRVFSSEYTIEHFFTKNLLSKF